MPFEREVPIAELYFQALLADGFEEAASLFPAYLETGSYDRIALFPVNNVRLRAANTP